MSKPIIRHCKNCQYGHCENYIDALYCEVYYKWVKHKRLRGLFCRFFRAKGDKEEN